MTQPNLNSAAALTKKGQEIASTASENLLDSNPEIKKWFTENPIGKWEEYFVDRVRELAESVSAGDPQIFIAQIQWARKAMSSRGQNTEYINATLDSLRMAVQTVIPSELALPVMDCLDEASGAYFSSTSSNWDSELDPGLPFDRLALHYVQMVVAGNVWPGMQIVLDALQEGYSVKDLYLRVLLPAQAEVGRLWHLNEVSVAEEHLVTSTTQRLMAVLASHASRKSDRGYTVVATAVAGNAHDIGIRTIAYLLEFDGWKTIFLGSDMPRSDMPVAAKLYEADLVLLSIALSTQIKALKQTIDEIRALSGSSVKIIIGGNGLKDTPSLWKDLGVDGYAAGVDEALQLCLEIVSQA